MWIPSITPMTPGNPAIARNSCMFFSIASPVGHLMKSDARRLRASATSIVHSYAVDVSTSNRSEISL